MMTCHTLQAGRLSLLRLSPSTQALPLLDPTEAGGGGVISTLNTEPTLPADDAFARTPWRAPCNAIATVPPYAAGATLAGIPHACPLHRVDNATCRCSATPPPALLDSSFLLSNQPGAARRDITPRADTALLQRMTGNLNLYAALP